MFELKKYFMSTPVVKAPFTDVQVEKLKEYQEKGKYHPFTCCSSGTDDTCERKKGTSQGLLIPSNKGWVCPCGQITQNWCYQFMCE